MADPGDISGNTILLTIFLKHDQSKVLEEFQTTLDARNWWERFPPDGVEVVSWNVVMGIGQIVTLRLPPDKLQAVNVELERSAWGVFRTETFISYDFMAVRERLKRESKARRDGGTANGGTSPNPQKGSVSAPVSSGAGGSEHPRLPHNGLYLNPLQYQKSAPTAYETQLGDALEAAFEKGIHELPALVAALNEADVRTPDGKAWTQTNFETVMKQLGGAEE